MALYFIRHGETNWNREKRFQSVSDVPLNARGLAQARCAAEELQRRGADFRKILCSPLQRAVRTAQIIGAELGLKPIVDQRLMEMDFGDWEAQLEADLLANFGEQFTAWRESHYTTAPPGGQCLRDVARRLQPLLEELRESAATGNVIVVAHQAIMMAMKAALTGDYSVAAAFSYKQNNDEIDIWDLQALQRIEFLRFNCASV